MNAEKAWIYYDVANSAYVMLAAALIPIYFTTYLNAANITESTSNLSYISLAGCISTLAMFFLGPALGGLSDRMGWRRPIFITAVLIGAITCSLLWAPKLLMPTIGWIVFLVVYIISKIAFNATIVVSDGMLNDITTNERMDAVSAKAYAAGYLGSCVPFIFSLMMVVFSDYVSVTPTYWSIDAAMTAAFIVTAEWWIVFSIPLFIEYKQIRCNDRIDMRGKIHDFIENVKTMDKEQRQEHKQVKKEQRQIKHEENRAMVKEKFHGFLESIREIKRNRAILLFILAFFFYIDGVYTIIDLAASYGGTVLGDNSTIYILAGLLITQIVAFPSTLIMSKLAYKYGTHKIIVVSIIGYVFVGFMAAILENEWQFILLAFVIGVFQGTIQSLSRSYFGRMIPKERTGQFFGIMDIFGKGATFIGTLLVFVFLNIFHVYQVVPVILLVMFCIGLILFLWSVRIHNYDRETEA